MNIPRSNQGIILSNESHLNPAYGKLKKTKRVRMGQHIRFRPQD